MHPQSSGALSPDLDDAVSRVMDLVHREGMSLLRGHHPQAAARLATVSTEPILLTRQQAAERCNVDDAQIQEWMGAPGFPSLECHDRSLRIHARLFYQWLADLVAASNAAPHARRS